MAEKRLAPGDSHPVNGGAEGRRVWGAGEVIFRSFWEGDWLDKRMGGTYHEPPRL